MEDAQLRRNFAEMRKAPFEPADYPGTVPYEPRPSPAPESSAEPYDTHAAEARQAELALAVAELRERILTRVMERYPDSAFDPDFLITTAAKMLDFVLDGAVPQPESRPLVERLGARA